MMLYLRLFCEFFKAGLFAVGGGLATLPFLYNISDTTNWFTHAQLADMVAISESTPGPIGVNMATYVGFETGGILGSVIATIGLIVPSVIIVLIIAGFLKAFRNNKYVNDVFYGLRPASSGLITAACWSIICIALLHLDKLSSSILDVLDLKGIILAVSLFVLTHAKKIKNLHPIFFLTASAIIGMIFKFAGV